jgi:hypothetical protein
MTLIAKGKRKTLTPELVLTSQFFKWLFYTCKKQFPVTFHIANEGKRARHIAAMMGLKAGVPDIFMAYPIGPYSGLFIELKIKPNKPSEAQLIMMGQLEGNGYRCHICYTLDEAMDAVNDYLLSGG